MSSSIAPTEPPASLEAAVVAINELIAAAQQPLTHLADTFNSVYDIYFTDENLTVSALESIAAELEPHALSVLEHPAPRLVDGIGLVWVSPQDSSGMLWWRAESDTVARKHHVFNPDSDSYYDYRKSVWFLGAYSRPGLSIVGPYIDAWGTDDHTLTASIKMARDDSPIGVAAADLNLEYLAAHVEATLAALPGTVLVENDERVIASNVALLTPGLRVEPFMKKTGATVSERYPTALHTWQLITLE